MKKQFHFMRRVMSRLFRRLSRTTTPHDQIADALDAALRKGAATELNTVVMIAEIDDFLQLRANYSGPDLTNIVDTIEERLKGGLLWRDMVRRLDGGQFAIVLSSLRGVSIEDMMAIAAQIQRLTSMPIIQPNLRAMVSISIGCAAAEFMEFPTGPAMIEAARIAQMEASLKGPNALRIYDTTMGERTQLRRDLGKQAKQAMKSGEIQAYFQPQISLSTQKITGFEALARWHHAERGIISPAEFLPVLEEAGMMRPLGQIMLRDALDALQSWDAAELDIPQVSVNMCAEELRHPDVATDIRKQLETHDMHPKRLVIEILETVYVGDTSDPIIQNINAISDLGCQIDLDDFGTGHTSIKSVRNFAVDRIKIDRSFITEVNCDCEQQQVVKTILSMAEHLKVDTLAEGVETQDEVAYLANSGCGHAQGYAIARPLPKADAIDWVHARRLQNQPISKQYAR